MTADEAPRPWLAVLLNLAPGLGNLYAGDWRLALVLPVADIALAWLLLLVVTRADGGPWNVVGPAAFFVAWRLAVLGSAWRSAAGVRTASESPPFRRMPKGRRVAVLLLFFAVLYALSEVNQPALRTVVGHAYRIPSGAMAPAIQSGDFLLAPEIRRGGPVRRDEPVVYRHDGVDRVHRVAGLAGDRLEMRSGVLWRNGEVVREPYAHLTPGAPDFTAPEFEWQAKALPPESRPPARAPTARDWGPIVVSAESVFVLGDDRDNSLDSRYIGFVSEADLVRRPRRIYFSRDPATGRIRWERIGRDIK